MKRLLLCGALLTAFGAQAGSIDGAGRISIGGGVRWIPNWFFVEKALEQDYTVVENLQLGPSGVASFGYGVTAWLELAIDLVASWEGTRLTKPGGEDMFLSSFMAAGLLGFRVVGKDLVGRFSPWATVQGGGLFSSLNAPGVDNAENMQPTFAAGGGFDIQFSTSIGLSLDVRYIYGRSFVPGISGINVGGVLATLSVVIFFPAEPKRELAVPGF